MLAVTRLVSVSSAGPGPGCGGGPAPVAMRPPSGEVGEHGQVEGDREGFRHFEDVSLPQGDRFAVAAVLPLAQNLDLRVRVEVDDPVLRDAGIRILTDLAHPVLALAARATGDR